MDTIYCALARSNKQLYKSLLEHLHKDLIRIVHPSHSSIPISQVFAQASAVVSHKINTASMSGLHSVYGASTEPCEGMEPHKQG